LGSNSDKSCFPSRSLTAHNRADYEYPHSRGEPLQTEPARRRVCGRNALMIWKAENRLLLVYYACRKGRETLGF